MNQILYENVEKKVVDIKKIVIFFSIAVMVFGMALVGIGIYRNMSNTKVPGGTTEEVTKPIISANMNEDTVIIKVSHDKDIERIIYSWNNGEEYTILGRNRKEVEETIDMPVGENILNVKATDVNGQESTYTQTFVLNNGVDIEKPTIDLNVTGNQIKITAKDETAISYITYRWNNEDETKVDVTDESNTIIETTIPIKKGENSLTVIAIDSNNNSETKIQNFKAVTKPIIEVHQYGKELVIKVTDEVGLKKVIYSVNGVKYRWTCPEEGRTEWTHTQELSEGQNTIIIEVWNTNDVEADKFQGRCNYIAR